jgi:hypothetical protein
MKTKFLTFITALTLVVTSCSSDSNEENNSTDFFIKAKINGQNTNVTYLAQATLFGTGDNKTLKLYAGNSLAQIYPFFSFQIDNLTQITTGTYNSSTHTSLFQFYDSNQKGYGNYLINSNDFQVQITEVTNTLVRGTFQGTLVGEVNLNESITITEGEFYLPRYYNEYGNTIPSN